MTGVTAYEIAAAPGGPRTHAIVLSLLRDAGAEVREGDATERRSWDQGVGVPVRVAFEIGAGLERLHDAVLAQQRRFPGLGIQISEHVPVSVGRHERAHSG
jgi:hypothetical protein